MYPTCVHDRAPPAKRRLVVETQRRHMRQPAARPPYSPYIMRRAIRCWRLLRVSVSISIIRDCRFGYTYASAAIDSAADGLVKYNILHHQQYSSTQAHAHTSVHGFSARSPAETRCLRRGAPPRSRRRRSSCGRSGSPPAVMPRGQNSSRRAERGEVRL